MLFDVRSDINFESVITLYFKDEKSQLMIPLNKEEKT